MGNLWMDNLWTWLINPLVMTNIVIEHCHSYSYRCSHETSRGSFHHLSQKKHRATRPSLRLVEDMINAAGVETGGSSDDPMHDVPCRNQVPETKMDSVEMTKDQTKDMIQLTCIIYPN